MTTRGGGLGLAYENVIITTKSDPEAFPSALRQKRKTQTKHHETGDKGTLVGVALDSCHFLIKLAESMFITQVSEKCPACGHLEAYSKEMQVRLRVDLTHTKTK